MVEGPSRYQEQHTLPSVQKKMIATGEESNQKHNDLDKNYQADSVTLQKPFSVKCPESRDSFQLDYKWQDLSRADFLILEEARCVH